MITLDQVELLEQKVESAVEKIRALTEQNKQLQAENDALCNKCSELSNSLSASSERLTFFEQDQNKIENGILNALDRLNSIENIVLGKSAQESSSPVTETPATSQAENQNIFSSNQEDTAQNNLENTEETFSLETEPNNFEEEVESEIEIPVESVSEENQAESSDETPGFDIF